VTDAGLGFLFAGDVFVYDELLLWVLKETKYVVFYYDFFVVVDLVAQTGIKAPRCKIK
jgi:hypothetical protein